MVISKSPSTNPENKQAFIKLFSPHPERIEQTSTSDVKVERVAEQSPARDGF
jgi:hypothetical protein